ncbi:ABC-type multidrug transport system permease subunit [Paraburkholderia sp. GAS33]|jgi:ABC-type multidrug transport system permease subunit
MPMRPCRSCGHSLWDTTTLCTVCGVKQRNVRVERTIRAGDSGREVSGLFLFLFGFFYLQYKGWYKAAIVHALLCFCLMGTFWIAIPFYAKKFVDSVEGPTI